MNERPPPSQARRLLIGWLGLTAAWAVVVYAEAYPRLWSGHATLTMPPLPTALHPNASWAALPAAALMLVAAYGLGRKALARAEVPWGRPWHADIVAPIVGLVPLGLAFFVLGIAGLFVRWALATLLGALVVVGARENLALVRKLGAAVRSAPFEIRRAGPAGIVSAVLIGLFGLLGAITAVAPETSADALFAHLLAVSRFVTAGRFTEIPFSETRHVPELAHVLFVPLYAFLGDVGPKALVFLQAGLLVLLTGMAAAELVGKRGGWIAALLVASTPAYLSAATIAYTDVQLALFAATAFWVATQFGRSPHGALLAGVLAGAAAGTKYLGAPLVLSTAILVAWSCGEAGLSGLVSRRARANATRVLVAAVVVAAPFYLKNWSTFGNPFYPMFTPIFGAYRFEAGEVQGIIGDAASRGMGRSPLHMLLLPWNLTVHGERFDGCLGGAYLALLPLLPVIWRARPLRGLLLATALFVPPFWLGQHTLRWMLAVLPLLAIAIAFSLERFGTWEGGRKIGQRAFTGLLLATAALHLPFFSGCWLRGWFPYEPRNLPTRAVIGGQTRDEYLTSIRPIEPLARRFVEKRRPDDRILSFPEWDEEAPPIWFDGTLVNDFFAMRIVRAMLAREDDGGPAAMYAILREHGITHLLLRGDTTDARLAHLNESSLFGQQYLEPIDSSGAHTLFAVRPRTMAPVFLDLVARLGAARVEPKDAADPAARAFSFDAGDGSPRLTLTVLAGGRVAFPIDALPEGARFESELAMPWAIGDGAIAVLSFVEPLQTTRLVRQTLSPKPASKQRAPRWVPVRIDLAPFAGRSGELVLETLPGPANDASGDWIGWAQPRVFAATTESRRGATRRVAIDLYEHFDSAKKEPAVGEQVRKLEFLRSGQRRSTVVTLAFASIAFAVVLPHERPAFEASIAMPFPLGDGAVATLRFSENGQSIELWRQALTPAPRSAAEDLGWTPVRVDLSRFAGHRGEIVLSAEPGPAGDATADWIGWSDPRISVDLAPADDGRGSPP